MEVLTSMLNMNQYHLVNVLSLTKPICKRYSCILAGKKGDNISEFVGSVIRIYLKSVKQHKLRLYVFQKDNTQKFDLKTIRQKHFDFNSKKYKLCYR